MNSNDDQSSLPATKICTRRRNAKRYTSRGALFTLLVAVAIFLTTPRFAAQTPGEPPPAAPSQQQSTPAPAQQQQQAI